MEIQEGYVYMVNEKFTKPGVGLSFKCITSLFTIGSCAKVICTSENQTGQTWSHERVVFITFQWCKLTAYDGYKPSGVPTTITTDGFNKYFCEVSELDCRRGVYKALRESEMESKEVVYPINSYNKERPNVGVVPYLPVNKCEHCGRIPI